MPQLDAWEYLIVSFNQTDATDCLNTHGAQGWRVVAGSVHQLSSGEWRVILERAA